MHNHRKLDVWKESIQLTTELYKMTQKFPKEELFGLTAQMRKAAVSIPSNIAEGCGRNTNKDFDHFLAIALGSSFELETQFIVAMNLDYVKDFNTDQFFDKLDKIQKMIYKLKESLLI